MIQALLAIVLAGQAGHPTPDELKAFRTAFDHRRTSDDGRFDSHLAKAMDIVAYSADRALAGPTVANGEVDRMRASFESVLGKSEFERDPTSLSIEVSSWKDLTAVGVRMGAISRLSVFDKAGRQWKLPARLRWQPDYFGRPSYLPDGGLVVDSAAILDAGNRYTYRLSFLRQHGRSFETKRTFNGTWHLESADWYHVKITKNRVMARTTDLPKSFNTAMSQGEFERDRTWQVQYGVPSLLSNVAQDPDYRAVDNWMAAARRKGPHTGAQSKYRRFFGSGLDDLSAFGRRDVPNGDRLVTFNNDRVFRLRRRPDGWQVLSFDRIKPPPNRP